MQLLYCPDQVLLNCLVLLCFDSRYPKFTDALRDLDDCLTMVHLFAALPALESEKVQVKRIHNCRRLVQFICLENANSYLIVDDFLCSSSTVICLLSSLHVLVLLRVDCAFFFLWLVRLSHEWQAYISRTHKLRKTFISVKGIYYQVS